MVENEIKVISSNKKAFHNYEIGEKWEAGIALKGTEVKALRDGRVNLGDGWVNITDDLEAVLMEIQIGHYTFGNYANHEERRNRKLLLNKNELTKISKAIKQKGLSVVPTRIYFKGSFVKVEIAIGRGKKSHDKRESSKENDAKREIARTMRGR
ncbi:MAG: SsrA-binding protein SmpB [Proteobacteria bacterium]|nr:MAG: SsrA-binding protein SmpB [Pseudomonadota bacterium]